MPKPVNYSEPNWDLIENDVITRLRCLKAIWRHTDPQSIQLLAETAIIPVLTNLMLFCDSVEITEADDECPREVV